MAEYAGDSYAQNISKEINYLQSILNFLKPTASKPNPDWSEVVEEQKKVLNTLRGDFATKVTDLEQKMKENTIRISGVPEKPNEHTVGVVRDFFSEQLKLAVYPEDIECCYRCGKFGQDRRRVILVKFASCEVRKKVMKRKEAFSRNDICHELCSERYKIKREAISKFGKNKVSIVDGSVQVTMQDGNRSEKFHTLMQFRNFASEDDSVFRSYFEYTPHTIKNCYRMARKAHHKGIGAS